MVLLNILRATLQEGTHFISLTLKNLSFFEVIFKNNKKQISRQLVLVAKIIQNIANATQFTHKEPYMQEMNDYVNFHVPKAQDFLNQLTVIETLFTHTIVLIQSHTHTHTTLYHMTWLTRSLFVCFYDCRIRVHLTFQLVNLSQRLLLFITWICWWVLFIHNLQNSKLFCKVSFIS